MWACANAVGGLENVIQQTIDYTKDRTTFGQPLINNQYVHFRFAELMTEVEALKALTYQRLGSNPAMTNPAPVAQARTTSTVLWTNLNTRPLLRPLSPAKRPTLKNGKRRRLISRAASPLR